jgi:hypothetical protein
MNLKLNPRPERPVQVSPSPDTFLDPQTAEICAGCGQPYSIEHLSLFFCCCEYFCEECSCACSFDPAPGPAPRMESF